MFLILLIFFREKPKTPPSASSENEGGSGDLMANTKKLLANSNFKKLIVTFGIVFGTVNTLGTVVGIMTNEFGFSDADASVFGAVFIIGGIIGSGVFGTYVELTRKYKLTMIMIGTIATLGPILLIGLLFTGQVSLVSIANFIIGFDLAILPVGIDFGVEITFPVPEPVSTGLLMSCSQFFGIVLTVVCTALISLHKKGCVYAFAVLVVFSLTGLVFAVMIQEDLRRLKYEKELKQGQEGGEEEKLLKTRGTIMSC